MSEKPKRRWLQISLKTMLVAVTVACVALGWLAYERNEVGKRQAAIAAIEELGGIVKFDEEISFRPGWLRPVLGDTSGGEVVGVDFRYSPETVTDAGLAHLEGLTKLRWLDLNGTPVTDAGLVHLQGLTKLEGLTLANTPVTDSGLVHLRGLTRLERLRLDGTQVTDAGLVYLQGLTKLRWLMLANTPVKDAGLVHLQGLTELSHLFLNDIQVTDAGLVHLQGLTKLKLLSLYGTDVTDQGVGDFKKVRPNAEIER